MGRHHADLLRYPLLESPPPPFPARAFAPGHTVLGREAKSFLGTPGRLITHCIAEPTILSCRLAVVAMLVHRLPVPLGPEQRHVAAMRSAMVCNLTGQYASCACALAAFADRMLGEELPGCLGPAGVVKPAPRLPRPTLINLAAYCRAMTLAHAISHQHTTSRIPARLRGCECHVWIDQQKTQHMAGFRLPTVREPTGSLHTLRADSSCGPIYTPAIEPMQLCDRRHTPARKPSHQAPADEKPQTVAAGSAASCRSPDGCATLHTASPRTDGRARTECA